MACGPKLALHIPFESHRCSSLCLGPVMRFCVSHEACVDSGQLMLSVDSDLDEDQMPFGEQLLQKSK